jgi:hypothetical protein
MRGWLKLGVFWGAIIAGIVYVWPVFSLPTDDAMITRFEAQRATFDQLQQMLESDGQRMWIGTHGRTWPERLEAERGISPVRVGEYRRLLRAIDVSGAHADGNDYAQFHISIPLCPGCAVKSYVYATTRPLTLTDA